MPELRQEYLDILEKREWSVSGYTDDGRVELEWWSPAGEDFLVCVNVENFPDEILDYSDDFDPDEHLVAYTMGDRAYIKFVMKPRQQLIVALKSRKWWWNSNEEAWSTYLNKLDKEWVQSISTRYADYV